MRGLFSWVTWRSVCAAVLACAGGGMPDDALAVDWRIATAYPVDNFHTVTLQQFASAVVQETQGAVRLEIYPNASLLKAPEIFPAVKAARIEGGELILSSLSGEAPIFGLDSLPFVVRGYDDARLLWKLSRPVIEKRLAEHGVQLLYAVPWPPQNLYSTRPLMHAKDTEGMRMRTYNPMMQRLTEILGAKPVDLQTTELAQAIGQKKVDLMLTSSWTGVEVKAWTGFSHYYSNVNAWIPKNVVFVNKKAFDALGPDVQARIKSLSERAEDRGWRLSQQNSTRFDQELATSGIKVQLLDPLLVRQFQRHGERLAFEWLRTDSGEGLQVLLSFQMEIFNQGMAERAKR